MFLHILSAGARCENFNARIGFTVALGCGTFPSKAIAHWLALAQRVPRSIPAVFAQLSPHLLPCKLRQQLNNSDYGSNGVASVRFGCLHGVRLSAHRLLRQQFLHECENVKAPAELTFGHDIYCWPTERIKSIFVM